ncbi:MAG: molybdenum cofactor guanylyltransferase [Acidobacteria bacterium]|nr:molybdenum cofactor guanylyltransferase [Acidobacteriota bacterium]
MGQDKALIRFRNQPLVQIAADLLSTVCKRVFLLAPMERYPFLHLPHVADRFAGGGPLVALVSGLEQSEADLNLFLACDMPFITQEVLSRIVSLAEGVDAVVPQDDKGRWFPVSAAYRKSCIPAIEKRLHQKNFRVDSFFPEIVIRPLPTRDYSDATFANINSPAQLARLIRPGTTEA